MPVQEGFRITVAADGDEDMVPAERREKSPGGSFSLDPGSATANNEIKFGSGSTGLRQRPIELRRLKRLAHAG
jgi:hypothetical protein